MKLDEFKDIHKGKCILILGLGPSLDYYPVSLYKRYITIGVNDIENKAIIPDYTVFYDSYIGMEKKNRNPEFVRKFNSKYLFAYRYNEILSASYLDRKDKIVDISESISYDEKKEYDSNQIYHFKMSPLNAITIAIYMGASVIGVVGVDFINFDNTLVKSFELINNTLKDIKDKNPQIRFYNFSLLSNFTAFEKKVLY